MEELLEFKLKMKKNKITALALSEASGCYSYSQVRRMLKGNPSLKEMATLKTILSTLI